MKTYLPFCLLLFIILTASCKKDNGGGSTPAPDSTLPTVTLTGVANGDTLRNLITAEIKADDNDKIVKLEAFANDSLVSSASNGSLKLSWETFKFKDGDYNLKIVATDGTGNKKEVVTKVVLSNALISVSSLVDNNYESTSYVITDSAGKVLNTLKFPKNTQSTGKYSIYPKTAFTGKKVNVMRIRQTPNVHVKYFFDIKRGDYFTGYSAPNSNFKIPTTSTNTQLTIKNIPQAANYTIGNAFAQGSFQNGTISQLTYSASKSFLLQIETANSARYQFFDIPNNAANFEINADLAVKNSLQRTFTFPASIEHGAILAYSRVEKDFEDAYLVANKNFYSGNTTKVFYPEGSTDEMYGRIFFREKQLDYSTYYYDNIPAIIPKADFNINVQSQQIQNFNASFTGDFQYYMATFVMTGKGSIEVYGLKNQNQFKFPDISGEIDLGGLELNKMILYKVAMIKYSHPVDYRYNLMNFFESNSINFITDKKAVVTRVEKFIN